jgi:hypothetical protein
MRFLKAFYLRFWLRTDCFCNEYTWADAWEIARLSNPKDGRNE